MLGQSSQSHCVVSTFSDRQKILRFMSGKHFEIFLNPSDTQVFETAVGYIGLEAV